MIIPMNDDMEIHSMNTYIINYVFFRLVVVSSWQVDGTYDIDLIVLKGRIIFVYVYNVIGIVYSKSETDKIE